MAIIGACIIGAAALGAAYMSSQSAQSAASQAAGSSAAATQAQLAMYYQARQDLQPWRVGGAQAVNALTRIIQAGPGGQIPETLPTTGTTISGVPVSPTTAQPQTAPTTTMVPWNPGGGAVFGPGSVGGVSVPQGYYGMQTAEGADLYPLPEGVTVVGGQAYRTVQTAGAGGIQATVPGMTTGASYPAQDQINQLALPSTWGDWADKYKASPSYNFLMQQGTQALERGAAARGKQLSGGEQKALVGYGQNLASTDYQNWLNQWYQSLTPWQSLAGLGLTSAQQTAQAGIQTGQGVAQTTQNYGTAQAAGTLGATSPYAQTMQWGGNQLANMYMGGAFNKQTQPQDYTYDYGGYSQVPMGMY